MVDLDFLKILDEKQSELIAAANYIWEHPETAFIEYNSAAYLCAFLEKEGFQVTRNLAQIPTAFSASFGHGKPVIGILGEFDALNALSQAAGKTTYCPTDLKNGHGCGHNLLAAGSLGAAIAVKSFLEQTGCEGTIIYFGCPGEEGGSGKAFMARDGIFHGLDAALTWHPDETTGIRGKTSLANCQIAYRFEGTASHASLQPHLGRSALDAAELMNIGTNFLREHIIDEARIHYSFIDAGGFSPNVVQSHAEVLYLIRAPKNDQVQDLHNRVDDIANGAALMTGTTVTPIFIKACSNTLLNHTLQTVLYEKMEQIGVPSITTEDIAFASKMAVEGLSKFPKADAQHPIHADLIPYTGQIEIGYGSTDVGDVSWICPTAQIKAATHAYGTPNHSWQQTAQGKAPLAHKMMLYVAKSMAAAAAELISSPVLLQQAQKEHQQLLSASNGYQCPIPEGVQPLPVSALCE